MGKAGGCERRKGKEGKSNADIRGRETRIVFTFYTRKDGMTQLREYHWTKTLSNHVILSQLCNEHRHTSTRYIKTFILCSP